jgi:hypothetical protein
MERLTKHRHQILNENFPTIRRLARPGHLIVVVVDCPELLARRFGSAEAGTDYQGFCTSRGQHSLAWLLIPWEETDRALEGSVRWTMFKAMAERMHHDYIPACCINGKDGVRIGYCYCLVPREGEIAGTLIETLEVEAP